MGSGEIVWGLALCCTLAMALFGSSHDELALDLSYDYKDALGKAICSSKDNVRGSCRRAKESSGGETLYTPDVKNEFGINFEDFVLLQVNLVGGYYDAGDNVKFLWPMAFSLTLLSWAAVEYRNEISSADELNNLRTAIRGGGKADHQCWERPEEMDTPRTLYKITSDSPGSEVAADAATALSADSLVFQGVDSNYSKKLLSKSKSLFNFADKYRGFYNESLSFYRSYTGYQDLSLVVSNQGWSESALEFSQDGKFPGAQALLAQHVGAIVGGPDSKDRFKDLRSDYSHSEPTTYINAAFVGAVAALLDETRGASATAAE
ncbi:Endoglucanase 18 [Hibiscus syriacus]|uniref:Endoglucanase n=1 Tax=Hibiscus syriacus TaxID=106335 RepID=A0A6A2YX22_HIBSY|nr:Endoglucanase 18 [Hibiscus syriacus]